MSRYINADEIVYSDVTDENRPAAGARITYKGQIDRIPTADVAPVVHGHWKTPEKQFPFWDWKCSACGCEEYRQRDSHGNYRRMNFCPNCGAKMDESEDNDSE